MTAGGFCVGISLCGLKNFPLKLLDMSGGGKISNMIPRADRFCASQRQPAKRNPTLKHVALQVQRRPAVTGVDIYP